MAVLNDRWSNRVVNGFLEVKKEIREKDDRKDAEENTAKFLIIPYLSLVAIKILSVLFFFVSKVYEDRN
ncbi:hypothetical protein [Desulfurobacterium sp.]